MSLQHLSNISYDVRVAPQQMLVLDTGPDDNDVFYGKVYATGSARISGDKGAVRMDITAATDGNSSFVLPLSSKSNISNADFVRFVQPEKTDTLDNVARKKLLFERKHRQRADAASQMNITMALNVRPDAEVEIDVEGNTVKGRGEGTLNLEINPGPISSRSTATTPSPRAVSCSRSSRSSTNVSPSRAVRRSSGPVRR